MTNNLEAVSQKAHQIHTQLLRLLLVAQVKRMSSEQQYVSNGLQALENLFQWRRSAEWAIAHNLPNLASNCVEALERNIQLYDIYAQRFSGADEFLAYAQEFVSSGA